MAKYRKRKDTDLDTVEKAYQMLLKLTAEHPEISPTLWVSAFLSMIVNAYKNSELSYEEFKLEINNFIIHAERWWNE